MAIGARRTNLMNRVVGTVKIVDSMAGVTVLTLESSRQQRFKSTMMILGTPGVTFEVAVLLGVNHYATFRDYGWRDFELIPRLVGRRAAFSSMQ